MVRSCTILGDRPCASAAPRAPCLTQQPPTGLVANLPHEPIRAVHVREQQRVAHLIESHAKPLEALGRDKIEMRQPVVVRQAMIGGETKPSTPHLGVIVEIGTATAPPAMLDVVREK